jgi:hypothetical protein
MLFSLGSPNGGLADAVLSEASQARNTIDSTKV